MSITSRSSREDEINLHLKRILLNFTDIGEPGSGADEVLADTTKGLIQQLERTVIVALTDLEKMGARLIDMELRLIESVSQTEAIEEMLEKVVGNVDYDSSLDASAGDMMDALMHAGFAHPTDDGDIKLLGSASKSELKSVARATIVRWIEERLSS
jgi:hypothetical protein